jgi:hypothetical protein
VQEANENENEKTLRQTRATIVKNLASLCAKIQ